MKRIIFMGFSEEIQWISWGASHKNNNCLSTDELIIKLKYDLSHNLSDIPTWVFLSAMYFFLQDNLNGTRNSRSIYCQLYHMALDISEPKIIFQPWSKANRSILTNICKISFLKKYVELIHVPYILHDPSVKA